MIGQKQLPVVFVATSAFFLTHTTSSALAASVPVF